MQADLAKLLHHRRATVAERELKRDPKLSEAEEMWFRIAIVGAFRRYLKRPGRCYLSRSHLRSLTTYARSFCETAISPTKREFQRTELRMHFAEGEWAWEWEPVRKAA